MKKIFYKLMALIIMTAFSLADLQAIKGKPRLKRSNKVARFDFMCAIEAGNVYEVTQCLKEGLDVNERWGDGKDTPLMFAIKKLAEEKENEENLKLNTLLMLFSSSSLMTLGYLGYAEWMRPDNPENKGLKGYGKAFGNNWLETVKNRWQESIAYPVGGIMAVGATIFLTTLLVKHSKKIVEYLYYRWKTSSSRLMIIEKLIQHPSIDLSIRNDIKNREGEGQTALDVVQELLKKEHHSDYINNLLRTAETYIKTKLNPVPLSETK